MVTKKQIKEATKILIDAYKPKAIYLFGSYAWGKPSKDSDIDFFIVLDDEAEMTWDAFRIGNFALKNTRFPTDILVNKSQSFENRAEHPSSLEFKIKKDGILLYESIRRMVA